MADKAPTPSIDTEAAAPVAPCPTCGSSLGYYDGPNGLPRCNACFHELPGPVATPAEADDKAEPEPDKPKARDKAVRGPKESKR